MIGEMVKVKVEPKDLLKKHIKQLDKARKGFGESEETDLPVITDILKRKGYTDEGYTLGRFPSYHWYRDGAYWRLSGDYSLRTIRTEGNYLELEQFIVSNPYY